jgi:hypothetical protein
LFLITFVFSTKNSLLALELFDSGAKVLLTSDAKPPDFG